MRPGHSPLRNPVGSAGVLECPGKLGLLGGSSLRGGEMVSLSPWGASFPSCGMHTANMYQSESLRRGNLTTGEKTVALESIHCSSCVHPGCTATADGCTSAGTGRGHVSPPAPWSCHASHDHHHLYTSYFS